jgi:hypothetical protein
MTFASIPQGSRLFLDANTLVYYFSADLRHGAACLQLMDRIARQRFKASPRHTWSPMWPIA